ncbi:MAG: hypothetical protein H0T62_08820 [Parachlamydiaceae bacterium]|nr:hypothetical protein [Parachlamydiaceae bacterium]
METDSENYSTSSEECYGCYKSIPNHESWLSKIDMNEKKIELKSSSSNSDSVTIEFAKSLYPGFYPNKICNNFSKQNVDSKMNSVNSIQKKFALKKTPEIKIADNKNYMLNPKPLIVLKKNSLYTSLYPKSFIEEKASSKKVNVQKNSQPW